MNTQTRYMDGKTTLRLISITEDPWYRWKRFFRMAAVAVAQALLTAGAVTLLSILAIAFMK